MICEVHVHVHVLVCMSDPTGAVQLHVRVHCILYVLTC